MKLLVAFVLGAIAGAAGAVAMLAIAAAVDQQRRDPMPDFDAEPEIVYDPHLEAPFASLWERAR